LNDVESDMPSANSGVLKAFVSVTALFFAWGFITATMDPLVPAVRAIFSLSYAESMLTQFAFFMAYGVVSLPGAIVLDRLGYSGAIGAALAAMLAGCLIVPLATALQTYALVLVALFVIAGGITVLQVAANPLAASLGRPEGSHFRLTLSQAFNSLGTVLAPYIGARVMLHGGVFGGGAGSADQRLQSLHNIDVSFMILAGLILALGLFVLIVRRRIDASAPPRAASGEGSPLAALGSRWALFGAAAIFLYVGSEVSIASLTINFLHQDDILGVTLEAAGTLLPFYWGGAMVGRFLGSAVLAWVPAPRVLAAAAAVAALLCLGVTQAHGQAAAIAALSVGLMNSIMFPTIFTITLERSSAPTAATSGLLCMAIVGGAALPLLAGVIADAAGLHPAFFVPFIGYCGIAVFALGAARARIILGARPAASAAH
jgi:FHS family L-fucose permease-like MFS transporter